MKTHNSIVGTLIVWALIVALAALVWLSLGAPGVAADEAYPGPSETVNAYPGPAIETPAYPAPGIRDTPPPWLGPTLTAMAQATPDNVPAMVDDGAVSAVATATAAPTVTARPRSRHSNPTAAPTATPFPWRRLFVALRGA